MFLRKLTVILVPLGMLLLLCLLLPLFNSLSLESAWGFCWRCCCPLPAQRACASLLPGC